MGAGVREVVELRVHGVSGTPAAELLDRPLVRQVAGDRTAGFYRPLLPTERCDEPVPPVPDPGYAASLEGYAWGGLTSGAPVRALWLSLLPFALLNIAPRLRHSDVRRPRVLLALHRWAALGATTGLVIAASGVGIDLFGWQCGAGTPCAALPGWLVNGLIAMPVGGRLAVGALVPVALLVVLWMVSRQTALRYEHVPDGKPLAAKDAAATAAAAGSTATGMANEPDPLLTSEWLWRGAYMVDRLRRLHLVGGWMCVLLVLDAAIRPVELRIGADVGAGLTLVLVVVALAADSVVGRARRPSDAGRTLLGVVMVLALAATAVTVGALCFDATATPTPRGPGLPGYDVIITAGVGVQMLLVVALGLAAGRGAERWRGPAMAALGTLLGAVFSAGVYVYAATWLVTDHLVPSIGDVAMSVALAIPSGIQVAVVAFAWAVVVLVVVLVVAAALAWRSYRRARRAITNPDVDADYGYVVPKDRHRDEEIQSIFWSAGLVDRAATPVVMLIILAALAAVATTGWAVTGLFVATPLPVTAFWQTSYRFGAYAAAGVLVLLVLLGLAVFRTAQTRRSVGILWDLASFWPRSAHPLAPPCYAERTVPDLKERIRYYTGDAVSDYPHGALVLAAHSQGSVIAAAALLQMHASDKDADTEAVGKVAFLTYGCVLRRLYAKYFPVYFGDDTLVGLESALGARRWTNLWRHSDYLGGPVGRRDVDEELIDPRYLRAQGDLSYPTPGRHSMYSRDPAFQAAVGRLTATLPDTTPGEPVNAPPTVM